MKQEFLKFIYRKCRIIDSGFGDDFDDELEEE
nr:MAG TPA: hypothetical protein [Caudoviricetes sp.]